VTEEHLAAMNESAGEHPPEVDEFEVAGVLPARGEFVDAPYVAGCPAVLECRLHREVDLDAGGTVLLVGRVVGVRLEPHLKFAEGSYLIAPETLRPVGRLGGEFYSLLGELRALPRPVIADAGAPPVGAGPVQAR
jgi:flavin reductase (DIM6/NTAB) family NADH-FMN oxidoreductase RutF